MTTNETDIAPSPDKAALSRLGKTVRARLEADPSMHRVPVEQAELYAASQFLTPGECAHMISLVDAVARPSELFDQPYESAYRTSYSGDVERSDSVVQMVERRICDALGIDLAWGESVQGQRYEPGQEFKEHCDWFDTRAGYWPEEVDRGGQRSWTVMAFLNEVEEGGETYFPHLGVKVPPQQGALLAWNNALADGTPNHDTLHAALPVEKGVKYVVTKWFRTRPWR